MNIKKRLLEICTAVYNKKSLRIPVIVVLSFLFAEAFTRIALGIKPGFYVNDPWFTPVNKLQVLKGYYADSAGVQKVSPETIAEVAQRMNSFFTPVRNNECGEVYNLAGIYRKITHGFLFSEPNMEWLKYLKDNDSLSRLIGTYLFHPVNDDGYRSIPFAPYSGKRKKILLLGDSFTWGHSAKPITNSFADLLLQKGYMVYNTGISGADPPQYLAIAKKYIPFLNPDVVVVNVCLGNDIQFFERPVMPYQPIYYNTNAGNLYANPDGIQLSMQRAYELAVAWHSIPLTNSFNRFCAATAFTTLSWRVLNKYNMVKNQNPVLEEYQKEIARVSVYPTATLSRYLTQIETVADSCGAKLLVIAIPDFIENQGTNKKEVLSWFNGFPFQYSPVPETEYNKEDGHFNNNGHKHYATFIDENVRVLRYDK